jgi:ABC-type dipeptide/oligopeptide/nickel transport system ATPase component
MSNVLEIHDLCVHYLTETASVCACDSVSLSLERGRILGIVGESASPRC